MADNYNIQIQVEPGGSNNVGLNVEGDPTASLTMQTEVGGDVHAKNAEAWAVGKRGGVDVASTDVTYHNNAKYFAEQAVMIAGLTVTCSTLPAGSSATAVVTDVDGHKNIAFGIPTGADGEKAYIHLKWAAQQPTSDSDMKDTADAWMGICANNSSTAPTTYTSYVWSYLKGQQGDPGTPGTSGYMHIKWSATQPTADSDMSDTPNDYIGVYTGSSSTAPTTYTSYTWFKIKGETGAAGPGVASGGTTGQFLMKTSSTDYATSWVTPDSTPGTNPDNVIKSSAVKAVKDTADTTAGLIAEEYDSVAHGGYAVGDYCYKTSSGTTKLMRCTSAVSQGDSWNPTKWTDANLGEDVADLRDGLTSANQAIEQLEFKGQTLDYAAIQTFTAGHEGIVNWLKAKIEPVQAGTGDPSPSNVRAISGWTGANVSVYGKNMITVFENGSVNATGGDSTASNRTRTGWIPIKPNTDYTINASSSNISPRVYIYEFAGYKTGDNYVVVDGWKSLPYTFTSNASAHYMRVVFRGSNQEDITTASFTNVQIEEGSSDTSYTPIGNQYTVSFPTSAGTVYGGNLTVNADGTGKLVVKQVGYTVNNSSTIERNNSNSFRILKSNLPVAPKLTQVYTTELICSKLPTGTRSSSTAAEDVIFIATNGILMMQVSQSCADVSAFLTYIGSSMDIVYTIETPVEYDLSAPQVATLLGLNNIWCDTGDCSFQYSESVDHGDTTTAVTTGEKANWNNALNRLTDILDMLAFREAGFTATETHQQDTVIVVGTELYRTTAAIPAGNAIVPGTNCTKTTIIDEIVRLTTD